MRILLFRDGRYQEVGRQIKELWDMRKVLIKEIEKEIEKGKKKIQKRNIDSGSAINTTQGCNGSGPMNLTTPGCFGSGPMLHRP